MEVTTNSPVDGVGTIVESTAAGQTTTQEKLVSEKDYTEAVAFGTKARQAQFELAKRLVEKDKAELKNIHDPKVRDSIAKDVFGYDDYSEMVAIEGEDFVQSSGDNGDDELTVLKKQVKKLSYASDK